MKCRSFKVLREVMEALPKVTSKAILIEALPVLVETTMKIKTMRSTIKKVSEIAASLNEACSKYALEHESIFVGGKLLTDGKGVRHGALEAKNKLFHFAAGYGKPIRIDGDQMTQEFLDGLPKDFTKSKLELYHTGKTDAELNDVGLIRPANNVWSLDADDVANGDE